MPLSNADHSHGSRHCSALLRQRHLYTGIPDLMANGLLENAREDIPVCIFLVLQIDFDIEFASVEAMAFHSL